MNQGFPGRKTRRDCSPTILLVEQFRGAGDVGSGGEDQRMTADLKKRWEGQGACPFEPLSEKRIALEKNKWEAPVPHHERREPRELLRTNVGEGLDFRAPNTRVDP